MVDVNQSDRDRAAAWFDDAERDGVIRRGNRADIPLARAFARHRITATSEASLSVERMREALRNLLDGRAGSRDAARAALNTTAEGGER